LIYPKTRDIFGENIRRFTGQIAGLFREQRPRIQRDAADDDCRPDHVRRGDGLAKHEVRKH